jgi:hypothetical protein
VDSAKESKHAKLDIEKGSVAECVTVNRVMAVRNDAECPSGERELECSAPWANGGDE